MRAAIYTRISKDSTGQKAGVTRQLKDCKALARRLGWEVVATYDDNDISAYNGKTRPGFENLLAGIEAGRINAVICWHPDRLYRRIKDLQRLVEITDRGVMIASVNGGDIDLSNATGKMLARILGSVAEQESEHKAERQVAANQARALAGQWVSAGLRPFGYTRHGEVLENEAAAIRQAVTDILAGTSLRRIAIRFNEQGLTTSTGSKWGNLTLRRTLMNPLYAGIRVYRGEVMGKGQWPAIIDEDTHRGLVAFLSDPSRRPGAAFERRHMGSGVYRCGICGGPLYAGYPHGPARRMTYLCRPSAHVARIGEKLDEFVSMLVIERLSRPDVTLLFDDGTTRVDVGLLQAKRAGLAARLDEAATMFASGDIVASQLRTVTEDLTSQIAAIDKVAADAVQTNPIASLIGGTADELARRWDADQP